MLWCSYQQRVCLWEVRQNHSKYQIAELIERFISPLQETHEWLVLRYFLNSEGHLLKTPHLKVSLQITFHGWRVSAGTRFPVVSNCIHLHVHADTGHSAWSLNQLSICPACPPCRQLWHQVNQLLNWANFLSLLKSTFSSDLDPPGQLETGVPILMRQSAHRGRGFRQPGQLVTLDFVGEPLTPYWLNPLPWWGTEEQL